MYFIYSKKVIMDVSIIIVNYNTLQLTRNCINSVFDKTKGLEFEVILVDNASSDGSKEYFEKDERIKYIYNSKNVGFGRANNLGYKYAKGDYIFLLNSDTLLLNNAIYELISFMNNRPEVAICGGQLFNSDMKKCNSYGLLLPSIKQELDTLLRNCISKRLRQMVISNLSSDGFASIGYVTGADMMLRRDKIEEIGMFDPDFFMYYEETEMTYRYTNKGYKSVFYPKAVIQHLEGKSFSFKEKRVKMFMASRRLYYKKTGHNNLYYYACTLIYILYLITSIIKDIFKRNRQSVFSSFQTIKIVLAVK